MNTKTQLIEKAIELDDNGSYKEIIALLTDEILKSESDADLYIWRGNAFYSLHEQKKAQDDYDEALSIDPEHALAYYNRAQVEIVNNDFAKATDDINKVIKLDEKYAEAYISRGHIKRKSKKDYDGAIEDYSIVIRKKLGDINAYYYRGLSNYYKAEDEGFNITLLKKCIYDFDRYQKYAIKTNYDDGVKYAKKYLDDLRFAIRNPNFWFIKQLIKKIKETLRLENESYISHYTSLTALKNLTFENKEFWISEGNFMNDPSEGDEFFNFIGFNLKNPLTEILSPKPFIGSFVTDDKKDCLNMWRFYGKENKEEAKGCSVTIDKRKFIENLKSSLLNEKNKYARLDNEIDLDFYHVAYVVENTERSIFHIPNSVEKSILLTELMNDLKIKLEPFKNRTTNEHNRILLLKYLNSIAFLFKNDAFKNEDEVRLVMDGIEKNKKFEIKTFSPKVYIELVPIKDLVSTIIFGPKVDCLNEWKAAFRYSYENNYDELEIKKSKILFS